MRKRLDVQKQNQPKQQTTPTPNPFFFLLVAAWVCPGRSALQSAEQWCQRRYGHKHREMVSIIKMKQKRAQKGHQNNKTKQNIPTTQLSSTGGQEEGSGEITTESTYARVGRRVEEEGFGEIQEESTYARAGSFSAASQEESQKDSFVQKENPKVYGQLCNASRVPSGIPTQKKRYTCEVNPQANCISQKGETCET